MTFAYRRAAGALIGSGALVVSPLTALPASAATVDIQIVGINDFHGRLEADVNRTPADPSDDIGGAEQLAGLLSELRETNPNTVFVSAGDNIGASTFTSLVQDDEPTIEALDAMDLAVSAVGNHEFDRGFDDLSGRVSDLAEFPYLGANVYDADTGEPVLDEYHIESVGGIQIGFVGVVTADTPELVAPQGVEGLEFGDVSEAANRVAAQLTDGATGNGEADLVVLLAHTGAETEDCAQLGAGGEFGTLLNSLTDDTDVVFSGHTHIGYACEFTGTAGFDGPVVQSGSYGENVDLVELTYETSTGEVTAAAVEVVPVVGYPRNANPEVSAIVAEAVAVAKELGAEPLGTTTMDIRRAGTIGPDGQFQDNRGAESVLGNFIADVQLEETLGSGAQIALMNPGGLRDDFLVSDSFAGEACGVITLGEANTVQPFANGLVTMTLTGAQIKEVLEQQWQPEAEDRPVLMLGVSEGFFFSYDESRARGDRITEIMLDGTPIDPAAEYRVTVNSFLAAGGDNFDTLAEGTDRTELGQTDLEALTDYLGANSPVTPDLESRRAVEGQTAGTLPAGETCGEAAPQARAVDDSCTAAITEDGFVDVTSANPFEAVIDCLAYWGITKGTSATTYSPGSAVTRGQMAAFIARLVEASGGSLPAGKDLFRDDETSAFEDEINQLAAAGIVNGTGVGTYSPQLRVTRAQMAKFLVLAYEYRAAEEGQDGLTADADYFPDDDSSWAEGWINEAAAAGFTGGHVDGTYRPWDAVRRDHMAAFLTRVLDLLVENGMAEVPASAM